MKPEELLQAYEQIPKDMGLPPMQIKQIESESKRLGSRQEVLGKIRDFQPEAAWFGFQSANIIFGSAGIEPFYRDDYGEVLSAECWNGKTQQSLHIRYDGNPDAPWLSTIFQLGKGDECLVDEYALVATDKQFGKLKYQRYWEIGGEQGATVFLACFVGFEKNN